MKKLAIGLMLVLTSLAGARAQGLKDAYANYFTIGVAVNPTNVTDPDQMALIVREYNSITAENVMKPGEIHPAEGVWNFEEADRVADFCRRFGKSYTYMVVMDADSVMSGETLKQMVITMEHQRRVGILQTAPAVTGRFCVIGARIREDALKELFTLE